MQQEVWVDLVCSHVGGTARTAFLVEQMRCDALEAETVTAVGHEWVFDHAHTYRASEVTLAQSQQLSNRELHRVN